MNLTTPIVLSLVLAPFVLIVYAVAIFGEWLGHHGGPYRSFLESVTPHTWIARNIDGEGEPVAVAICVAACVIAAAVVITLVRRAGSRAWVGTAGGGRAGLFAWSFVMTTLRTVVIVAGSVAAIGAAGIAKALDLKPQTEGEFTGWQRWALAAAGIGLWSLFFTFRATRKVRTAQMNELAAS